MVDCEIINLSDLYSDYIVVSGHQLNGDLIDFANEKREEQIKGVFGNITVDIEKREEKAWICKSPFPDIPYWVKTKELYDSLTKKGLKPEPVTLFIWKNIPLEIIEA